jgi:ABC-type multidrug transport system ATPase subunit
VLDEPIAALDPATRLAVIEELVQEHRARGISIIFSSHITADLVRLCNRFVVLAGGKIALNESTLSCGNWLRVIVTGPEDLLRTVDFSRYRHVRTPKEGERTLVALRVEATDSIAQLPHGLSASIEDKDVESVLSEWMQ